MSYNLTRIADVNSTLEFVQNVNSELMLDSGGIALLIGLSIVIFLGFFFSTRDGKKSISATTFAAFTLSIFLRALDLVPNLALFITLLLCAATIAATWKE